MGKVVTGNFGEKFDSPVVVRDGYMDGSSLLICPYCKEEYLHHADVIVYDREEDETNVTKVHVNGAKLLVDRVPSHPGNPSARRHGVAIRFWCEMCGGTYDMTIAQHKGMTYLEWRQCAKEDRINVFDDHD